MLGTIAITVIVHLAVMGPTNAWVTVKKRFHNISVKSIPEEGELQSILRSDEFITHL